MKILALDVGTGTQDMMLYDSKNSLENAIKMVLPSPTRVMAKKVQKINQNIYIGGDIMGGGPVNKALRQHMEKDYRVVMEENPARTIRDDLERVSSMGVEIIPNSDNEFYKSDVRIDNSPINDNPDFTDFKYLKFRDVELNSFKEALKPFESDIDFDYLGIAVQDHGYSEKMGDRNFRFLKIREKLQDPLSPEEFAYWGDVPPYFTRMKAVERTLSEFEPLIMDSKFASICGATCDPEVEKLNKYVVMDVGNGHTTAASIEDGKIRGVMEHHTSSLTPEKTEIFLQKLVDGTLTHEEIYEDHGHGAWVLEPINEMEKVVITGPRRGLMAKTSLPVYQAAPAGDVMMTGPAGLIKSINYKIKN